MIPVRDRRGFGAVLVAVGIVSTLAVMSLTNSLAARLIHKKQIQRLNRLEGFFTSEIGAWHVYLRNKDNLTVTGGGSIVFDNSYVNDVPEFPGSQDLSESLGVTFTRNFAPSTSLIRRYSTTNLTVGRSTASLNCAKANFQNKTIGVCLTYRSGAKIASAITGTENNSCAIVNGGAWCWGTNSEGQLGNNSNIQSGPVQVQGLTSGVTAISAGTKHTCAIVNGGARCWGDNSFGQLGNNSYDHNSLVPVQVQGLTSGVTSIAATWHHVCAIVNGEVQCWGANYTGTLGNDSVENSNVPVHAAFP